MVIDLIQNALKMASNEGKNLNIKIFEDVTEDLYLSCYYSKQNEAYYVAFSRNSNGRFTTIMNGYYMNYIVEELIRFAYRYIKDVYEYGPQPIYNNVENIIDTNVMENEYIIKYALKSNRLNNLAQACLKTQHNG